MLINFESPLGRNEIIINKRVMHIIKSTLVRINNVHIHNPKIINNSLNKFPVGSIYSDEALSNLLQNLLSFLALK